MMMMMVYYTQIYIYIYIYNSERYSRMCFKYNIVCYLISNTYI